MTPKTSVARIDIQVWSDIVCPFCYIGKRNLERALERFERRESVRIRWRSFQLNADDERHPKGTVYERLARKYGGTLAWAKQSTARVVQMAAAVGLHFDFDRAIPANTLDAHRLVHLADESGRSADAQERLMKAYFSDGRDIAAPETLAAIAAEIGLDPAAAGRMLASNQFVDAVHRDQADAALFAVRGVPFFLLNNEVPLSGAQPPEAFLGALESLDGR